MKQRSIRFRILLLITLPLSAFLTLGTIDLHYRQEEYKDTVNTQEQIKQFSKVSALIHQLQLERAKSVNFLSNSQSKEDLQEQQNLTDQRVNFLSEKIPQFKKILANTREQILAKAIQKSEVISFFTGSIETLINVESRFSEQAKITGVPVRLQTALMLEMAKESIGQLRANVLSVLATNNTLTTEQHNLISYLKENIESNLRSPALIVSPEVRTSIENFRQSKNWNLVSETVSAILKNSKTGNFLQDSRQFFLNITTAIDQLAPIVSAQIQDTENKVTISQTSALHALLAISLLAVATLLISCVASYFFAGRIASVIGAVADRLEGGSGFVGAAVSQLMRTADELNKCSLDQCAALQETSSSVEQISAMLKNCSQLSIDAEQASAESKQKAERGTKIVGRMTESMDAISHTNEQIVNQMNESNHKVASIQKVIQDVGDKTKVINNIVFQTKLLSFNASVEAARAGEHGRGFAVVAEEVGNLAQMSGNAAKEINSILAESLLTVADIVKDTEAKVKKTAVQAQSAVDVGIAVTSECTAVLSEIVSSSQKTAEMISCITIASDESARGVEEILAAIQRLELGTHSNVDLAVSTTKFSNGLTHQAEFLRNASDDLCLAVHGKLKPRHFEWNSTFSLGVKHMDEEHKILIEKMNALSNSLAADSSQSLRLYDDFVKYTVQHFQDEEKYLESIEYSDLILHKLIHKKLLEKLKEFAGPIAQNKGNYAQIMNFCNDWLRDHILSVDMKYSSESKESSFDIYSLPKSAESRKNKAA